MPLSTKLWSVATVDKFINSRRQHFPLPAQFPQMTPVTTIIIAPSIFTVFDVLPYFRGQNSGWLGPED